MLDYYFIFRIVRKISKPFKEWEACKSGVIDADGEILVKLKDRSVYQAKTFDKIDLLCLKLRRVLAKAKIPTNPTVSIAAALWLLKEAQDADFDALLNETTTQDCHSLQIYIEQFDRIAEEIAGGGDAGGGTPSTNTSAMAGYPDSDIGPTLGKMRRKGKLSK